MTGGSATSTCPVAAVGSTAAVDSAGDGDRGDSASGRTASTDPRSSRPGVMSTGSPPRFSGLPEGRSSAGTPSEPRPGGGSTAASPPLDWPPSRVRPAGPGVRSTPVRCLGAAPASEPPPREAPPRTIVSGGSPATAPPPADRPAVRGWRVPAAVSPESGLWDDPAELPGPGSAAATAGSSTMTTPIPSATANAPTRPTKFVGRAAGASRQPPAPSSTTRSIAACGRCLPPVVRRAGRGTLAAHITDLRWPPQGRALVRANSRSQPSTQRTIGSDIYHIARMLMDLKAHGRKVMRPESSISRFVRRLAPTETHELVLCDKRCVCRSPVAKEPHEL